MSRSECIGAGARSRLLFISAATGRLPRFPAKLSHSLGLGLGPESGHRSEILQLRPPSQWCEAKVQTFLVTVLFGLCTWIAARTFKKSVSGGIELSTKGTGRGFWFGASRVCFAVHGLSNVARCQYINHKCQTELTIFFLVNPLCDTSEFVAFGDQVHTHSCLRGDS